MVALVTSFSTSKLCTDSKNLQAEKEKGVTEEIRILGYLLHFRKKFPGKWKATIPTKRDETRLKQSNVTRQNANF